MLTPLITLGQVLDAPGGRAVFEGHLPDALPHSNVQTSVRSSSVRSCGSPQPARRRGGARAVLVRVTLMTRSPGSASSWMESSSSSARAPVETQNASRARSR
jgi:hypothetical protein